jgi:plastocyanin
MKCNNLYLLLTLALVLGVAAAIPSAFAATVQVTIMPGSGSGQSCVSGPLTCFSPSIVNISPGDTVTWTNDDNVAHDLTDGLPYGNQTGILFDSGSVAPATTYSFTFQNSGDFRYFAKDTKWMVGEVNVGPSTGGSSTVPEFGSLAGFVVLVSIVGVVAVTRATKF